jgi:hypothetical protein
VALWFACRQRVERNGLLVGFRLRDPDYALEVTSSMLRSSLDAVLAEGDGRLLWWQPRDLTRRIAAQHAILVFGETISDARWGSIAFGERDRPLRVVDTQPFGDIGGAAAILITPSLKRAMNAIWQPVFGYGDEILFPDFDGFANAHRDTAEFPPDFPRTRLAGE